MRALCVLAIAGICRAGVVMADHISVDVFTPVLTEIWPGMQMWEIPTTVNARLTNTADITVWLGGIGGGFWTTEQIQPNGPIAPGASIEGPMFSTHIWQLPWLDPNLLDDEILFRVSQCGFHIDGAGYLEQSNWLIPPLDLGFDIPPVEIRRFQNDPLGTPEPATLLLTVAGLGFFAFKRS